MQPIKDFFYPHQQSCLVNETYWFFGTGTRLVQKFGTECPKQFNHAALIGVAVGVVFAVSLAALAFVRCCGNKDKVDAAKFSPQPTHSIEETVRTQGGLMRYNLECYPISGSNNYTVKVQRSVLEAVLEAESEPKKVTDLEPECYEFIIEEDEIVLTNTEKVPDDIDAIKRLLSRYFSEDSEEIDE